jgi:hypothetical protein
VDFRTYARNTLERRCTRFLHACSALCKCAKWQCRTCTPHHNIAGRSSVSLTQSPFAFPSNFRCRPPLTSYMPGRYIPCTRARHSSTHNRTLCPVHGLCTSALEYIIESSDRVKWVPCHHGMARPRVADGGNGLQIWKEVMSILNKQSRTADKGWSSRLGVGCGDNKFSP